jgi:polyisoprenoid-binding protein YceI
LLALQLQRFTVSSTERVRQNPRALHLARVLHTPAHPTTGAIRADRGLSHIIFEDAMNQNLAVIVCLSAAACAASGEGATAAVEGGGASFVVNTTVPGVSVKGKSAALEAHATIQRVPEGLRLENVEASLPVKSIVTGMAIRDEHMRRYIFTTAEGKTPDLHFTAEGIDCTPHTGHAGEFSCNANGTLTIRGLAHAFSLPLKLREDGRAFHASGEGVVKLSDYSIERPSQFGVKTANEVQLHLEFTAREASTIAAGGSR